VDDQKVQLSPEVDRPFDCVVMGMMANQKKNFFLPEFNYSKGLTGQQILQVQKQIFWLTLTITHGMTLKFMPDYTQLYVAIPDTRKVPESLGHEREFFGEYLEVKCGWTKADIQKRVHYFYTPVPLQWAQDTSKILGKDAKGRVIIGLGSGDFDKYAESVRALVRAYPKIFVIHEFEKGASAEGGDEDIIRTPSGGMALLLGRHRIRHYFEYIRKTSFLGVPINDEMVLEAKKKYSDSVYGLNVITVPEKFLEDTTGGNEELFHLDMNIVVIPDGKKVVAYVPVYGGGKHYDALMGMQLEPEFVRKCNQEYDAISDQMRSLGYKVVRMAYSDHPVRNPVNVAKFKDPRTGKYTIFLPKYPYQIPSGGKDAPQRILQNSMDNLSRAVDKWNQDPGKENFQLVEFGIKNVSDEMDLSAAKPNPFTDKQASLYREHGVNVIVVPSFMFGAGGIHCELLN
jgi:hypothetical protein